MEQQRFDEIAIAVAGVRTRRTALRYVFGGGLAALLAAVGLGSGEDEAAAKSRCARKCKKKNSKKKRRKCRERCEGQEGDTVAQEGTATLTSQSDEDCATDEGECVDLVTGTLTGTPIAAGTFEGLLTGTNFQFDDPTDTVTAEFTGTLTATETATSDTLEVEVELTLTQNTENGALSFAGTYDLDGGTGRFDGATGSGTIAGTGTRTGQTGTVDAFSMDGTIVLS